ERDPGRDLRIVGADRADLGTGGFGDRLADALAEGGAASDVVQKQRERSAYRRLDVTDPAALQEVLTELGERADRLVLYFALPPAITERACRALTSCRLPGEVHLAMEKPFGHDR